MSPEIKQTQSPTPAAMSSAPGYVRALSLSPDKGQFCSQNTLHGNPFDIKCRWICHPHGHRDGSRRQRFRRTVKFLDSWVHRSIHPSDWPSCVSPLRWATSPTVSLPDCNGVVFAAHCYVNWQTVKIFREPPPGNSTNVDTPVPNGFHTRHASACDTSERVSMQ